MATFKIVLYMLAIISSLACTAFCSSGPMRSEGCGFFYGVPCALWV